MLESLKNLLLVMASSGYLVSKSEDEEKQKLWTETWKRLDRFLPDLRKELAFDEPAEEPVEKVAGSAEAGPVGDAVEPTAS